MSDEKTNPELNESEMIITDLRTFIPKKKYIILRDGTRLQIPDLLDLPFKIYGQFQALEEEMGLLANDPAAQVIRLIELIHVAVPDLTVEAMHQMPMSDLGLIIATIRKRYTKQQPEETVADPLAESVLESPESN